MKVQHDRVVIERDGKVIPGEGVESPDLLDDRAVPFPERSQERELKVETNEWEDRGSWG